MEHALDLFSEQGFLATSVQEIAERSGISKGAFYLSFKSKDELILELIHHSLQEFIAITDRLVSEGDSDELLFNFYEHHFNQFLKQSGFGRLFMQEQTHFLDEDFLAQVSGYNRLFQDATLILIEKVYGEKVKEKKYDLVYTVLGLMKSYMEMLLLSDLPFDAKQLATSLVEKTDILAKHMTHSIITKETYALLKTPKETVITKERVLRALEETIELLDESVERESLLLLKAEVIEPTSNQAVKLGLLKNIETHPSCKRVSFLLRIYFEL